jgi:MinD-like ATPase involved in chromosome partitioning or flagellar assembly
MEPVSMVAVAIASALAAGAASGVTDVAKSAITDAYSVVKALLARKIGAQSKLVNAVEKLEAEPASAGRRLTLQEQAQAVKVDQDAEIMAAVQELLNRIKAQPSSKQHIESIQHAVGSYIAQADRGGPATVNVSGGKGKDD